MSATGCMMWYVCYRRYDGAYLLHGVVCPLQVVWCGMSATDCMVWCARHKLYGVLCPPQTVLWVFSTKLYGISRQLQADPMPSLWHHERKVLLRWDCSSKTITWYGLDSNLVCDVWELIKILWTFYDNESASMSIGVLLHCWSWAKLWKIVFINVYKYFFVIKIKCFCITDECSFFILCCRSSLQRAVKVKVNIHV